MEIERTIQFITEHLAQLAASVQKHDEQLSRMEAQAAKHDEQIAAVTGLVGRLAQAELRLVERTEKLENSQLEMHSSMTQLFKRIDRFIQGLEGNGHRLR